MKKRKILFLFPLVGLLLTGCSFEEVLANAQTWLNDKIVQPAKDFIDNITGGGKEEQKEDEGGKEEEKTVKRILVESYPESVAEGGTIDASAVTVRVFYSDNTEEVKQAEKVTIDTSVPGDNVPMTVEYGGKSDTVTVKVIAASEVVHATSFTAKPGKYTLEIGESTQITLVTTPEDATDRTFVVVSENEDVVSATNDGTLTGLKEGSSKISVTHKDVEKAYTFTINVKGQDATLPAETNAGFKRFSGTEFKHGEKVNFTAVYSSSILGMGPTGGNFISPTTLNVEDGKLVVPETLNYQVLKNADDNSYSFLDANGKYLAAVEGKNYAVGVEKITEYARWELIQVEDFYMIRCTSSKLSEDNARNLVYNASNPRFSCYKDSTASSYAKIAFYHNDEGAGTDVPVEGISFSSEAYEVEIEKSLDVVVNITPPTASDRTYSLELTDVLPEGCVELTGNTLKGNAIGTAKIVATSHANPELKAEATVKVIDKIVYNYGTAEAPLTVAEAYALVEAQNPTAEKMFVKGVVKSNAAWSSQYKNVDIVLSDGEHDFTVFRATTFPEGFDYAGITKDSLVGATVTATGTGKIYNTTHELDAGCAVLAVEFPVAKDIASVDSITGPTEFALNAVVSPDMFTANVTFTDETKGTAKVTAVELDTSVAGKKNAILTIEGWNTPYELEVTVLAEALNYGTAEAPLTVAEAYALVEAENPTTQAMYVKGLVKSNAAWSTKYKNVDIVLTDGEHDFTIFRTATFPQGFDYESIAKDSLVGATVTATGTGKVYNNTHELDQGCVVLAIEGLPEPATPVSIQSVSAPESIEQGATLSPNDVTLTVLMSDESQKEFKATNVELDTSVVGDAIEGTAYLDNLSKTFTIKVVEKQVPPTGQVDVSFSMEQLIDDPTAEYSGGSVKLETKALDEVLTLEVQATDGNSGKIYKDNSNGFQCRLYKSGSAKLVVKAADGYEIVSAVANAAKKGSNWWVAGSETAMTIADDKASASIGGADDMVVYSLAVSYIKAGETPVVPTEVSIASVTAPESIEQGAKLEAKDVKVLLNMSDGTQKEAQATGVALDTSVVGDAVEGTAYYDALSKTFTIKVVEKEVPPTNQVDVSFSMEQLIDDPTAAYTGGSVKLETKALDEVLTLEVQATDGNSGKIYKDNTNGFQCRLYKSGTGKLVVKAAEGYEIVSAVANAAKKGSNWYVAGSETAMTIADDKASATIGGTDDMVVYSLAVSYVAK